MSHHDLMLQSPMSRRKAFDTAEKGAKGDGLKSTVLVVRLLEFHVDPDPCCLAALVSSCAWWGSHRGNEQPEARTKIGDESGVIPSAPGGYEKSAYQKYRRLFFRDGDVPMLGYRKYNPLPSPGEESLRQRREQHRGHKSASEPSLTDTDEKSRAARQRTFPVPSSPSSSTSKSVNHKARFPSPFALAVPSSPCTI